MTSFATLKAGTTMSEETTMSSNPFPGLRAFEQKETHLFFGRDGQSKELVKRLQESRFLALVGVSGSGKSSLVRAGLLPALYGGLMSAVDSDWRIAVFRPGNNPIRNMARALITEAGLGGDTGHTDVEIAIAETTLRRGNLGLLELLRQAKRKVRQDGRPFLTENENVLVVVDQFEEIFRIIEQYDELVRVKHLSESKPDVTSSAAPNGFDCHPREEASAFVKLLLDSTQKNGEKKYEENLYVIVTMRSDYLGETAQFLGMPERINEGQYLIPRMSRDERRKAIVGPVAVAGGSIGEPLVNQLLNDAGENPGHLPILQHALMRMWELAGPASQKNGGLNLDHYDQIGKLSGALSQHANEAFAELSPDHQELAAKVFKCLTEKGLANREIRRPMKVADISAVVGAQENDVKTVVDCFRKKGRWFLMPPPHEKPELDSDTLIDISHESLISGWDKLSKWVNEEAESARTYKRLADTAILKDLGAEDFYRGPALQLALKWRQDNAPNPAWARRYHPEFAKAITFLDDSLIDTQKREQAEKDRIARDFRRRRNYNMILGILLIVSAALGVFAYTTQQFALDREKERLATETRLKETAITEQGKAVEASKRAEESKQLAIDAANRLQEKIIAEQAALKIANEARAVAITERDKARRLQKENQEQATTYGYFKDAFDHVASREYEKALSSLQSALTYYEQKERNATNDAEENKGKTNRIATIVNIADVHRSKGDPKADKLAVQEYDRAIAMMRPNDNGLLGPTLLKAGSVWKDSDDQDEAFRAAAYYERAAEVYERIGDSGDSSRALVEAGKIHLGFGDDIGFDRASKAFEESVKLLKGNDKQLALANADIGESYMKVVAGESESNDEDEETPGRENARAIGEKELDQLRSNGAKFLANAASAYQSVGDFKNAAAMRRKSGEILIESKSPQLLAASAEGFISSSALYGRAGDATEQASVLVEAGETFFQNGSETAKALANRLLEQAADVDQKNPSKQAATLSGIASIYADLEPPQKELALNYHQRAITFARQHNDKAAELAAILDTARAIEKLEGENGKTQLYELYGQLRQVYPDDPAKTIHSGVRFGRAVMGTSREPARVARADEFFAAALTLAKNQPDKKLVASVHMDIGVAYGRSRPKAHDEYKAALGIYEAEGDLQGQAMALYRLGILGGDGSREFIARALALFPRVIPTLEKSGKQVELAEAYYAWGSLYRTQKDYKAALNSYNRALSIYLTLPDQTIRVNSTRNVIRTTQRLIGTE